MQEQGIAVACVQHRYHERLAVDAEADMGEKRRVEDRVRLAAVVASPILDALDPVTRRGFHPDATSDT
jgi:hypothetical protein